MDHEVIDLAAVMTTEEVHEALAAVMTTGMVHEALAAEMKTGMVQEIDSVVMTVIVMVPVVVASAETMVTVMVPVVAASAETMVNEMVHAVVAASAETMVTEMVHAVVAAASAEMMKEKIGTGMRAAGAVDLHPHVVAVDHLPEKGTKDAVMTDPHLELNLPGVMKAAAGDLQHLNVMTGHPLLEMTDHQCAVETIVDLLVRNVDLQQERVVVVHGEPGAQMMHHQEICHHVTYHHVKTSLKMNPLRKAGKQSKGVKDKTFLAFLTDSQAASGIKHFPPRLKLLNEIGKEFW